MSTEEFIWEHREDDVRQLALQSALYFGIDMPKALQQIAGWQKARTKLPEWAAKEGLIYPPHLSMEQCSSELTARYKARLCVLRYDHNTPAPTLIDLTGGFGVDFSYMAQGFQKAIYVERNPELCEIARHNFPLLGLKQAEVVCSDAVEYLHQLTTPHPSPITLYLDPARRDIHGQKTYAISDCTPDVLEIKQLLLEKADVVIIKLSPMLDWHIAPLFTDPLLSPYRGKTNTPGLQLEIHIVSVDNECKELLLVLRKGEGEYHTRVVCVNLQSRGEMETFEFEYPGSETYHSSPIGEVRRGIEVRKGLFLYEPNASIMKAGCFAELAARFDVSPIAPNSHLFVSKTLKEDFPGRRFQITAVSSMNKKALKENLRGISRANIAVRNFPLSVAELRRRLKLADGGDLYLFATTTDEREHLLLFSKKN